MRKAARASSASAPSTIKLFAFTVSAMMAGVAGALYVPQVGIINPGEFEPGNSIEVVDLDGGRRARHADRADRRRPRWSTAGRAGCTGAFPEFWLFALGGLFVARHAVPCRRACGRHVRKQSDGRPSRRPTGERAERRRVDHVAERLRGRERPRLRSRLRAGPAWTWPHGRILYLEDVFVCFDGFQRASTACPSTSRPASCVASSARTAPARRR